MEYQQEQREQAARHAALDDRSNTRLGPYQLCKIIGRGSSTTVYQAYQPSLHRYVAIKLLHLLDPELTLRFEREAQAIARLQHPNILPVYDYGEAGDVRYLVMQYIESSVTLGDRLHEFGAQPAVALRLMSGLLGGLSYAHARGVIHRDIKPSNILLPAPEWPVLADFGIAKLTDMTGQLTRPGQVVGTVAYLAPEQARGAPADERTDVYAAGVVLFELLTGRPPFTGPTPMAVLSQHAYAEPPSLRSINVALPVELELVVQRALAKDPADRPQSAQAMAAELAQLARQIESAAVLHELLAPRVAPKGASAGVAAGSAQVAAPAVPRAERLGWRALVIFVLLVIGGLCLGGLAAVLLAS